MPYGDCYPQLPAYFGGYGAGPAVVAIPVQSACGPANASEFDGLVRELFRRVTVLEAYQLANGQTGTGTGSGSTTGGASAYDLWKLAGNVGNVNDFLASLKGSSGLSAYELWLKAGNTGTVNDFLASLKAPATQTGTGLSTQQQADLNAAVKSMLLIMGSDATGSFTIPHGLTLNNYPIWCQVQTPEGRPDLNVGAVQETTNGSPSPSLVRVTVPANEIFPAGSRIWVNITRQQSTVNVSV